MTLQGLSGPRQSGKHSGEVTATWVGVCPVSALNVDRGVCALVDGVQVALFRLADGTVHAISNFDPFSRAFVLSRGIVGDRDGTPKVASPIYKQSFELATGRCLDDPSVVVPVYPTRIVDGLLEVALPCR
jgi:nitrite reductase (NADH) small subunit